MRATLLVLLLARSALSQHARWDARRAQEGRLVCADAGSDLTFHRANLFNSSIWWWWPEGEAEGKKGESFNAIQGWFDTMERSVMLQLHTIFSQHSGATDNRAFVDVGSHQGWFSMISGAYGIPAIAFDMQPMCVQLFGCASLLNGFSGHEVHHGYATSAGVAAANVSVSIPGSMCVGGTSPYGPGGGERVGAEVPVYPIDIEAVIRSRSHRVLLMKIDTEGYECILLGAVMPVISHVDHIIVEVSPSRWAEHGVSFEQGVALFRELYMTHAMVARYLTENANDNYTPSDPAYDLPTYEAFSTHLATYAQAGWLFRNYVFGRRPL